MARLDGQHGQRAPGLGIEMQQAMQEFFAHMQDRAVQVGALAAGVAELAADGSGAVCALADRAGVHVSGCAFALDFMGHECGCGKGASRFDIHGHVQAWNARLA
ncbi:MAG: hypothetical protein V4723_17015 [Pseudomonadota bacterium]